MKYKIGDIVKIVDCWSPFTCENIDGRMDHWLGKTMTIKRAFSDDLYKMVEDAEEHGGRGWCWNIYCIEGLAEENKTNASLFNSLLRGVDDAV